MFPDGPTGQAGQEGNVTAPGLAYAMKSSSMPSMIYKILTSEQMAVVEAGGAMQAPVDLADGYVHFSTSTQVQETLAKWFRGQSELLVIAVDESDFGTDLKWEKSRGGEYFPHVYTSVFRNHIRSIWRLEAFDQEGAPLAPEAVKESPEPPTKPVTAP